MVGYRTGLIRLKGICDTPPSKDMDNGHWVLDPEGKADLFNKTFKSKYGYFDTVENEYADIGRAFRKQIITGGSTREKANKNLKKLNKNIATGPDGVPAKILRLLGNILDGTNFQTSQSDYVSKKMAFVLANTLDSTVAQAQRKIQGF